jgi:hypothetical protein
VDQLKEGLAPVYVWCVDNVGNIGEASASEIMVDRTGPIFRNLTPVDGEWHSQRSVEFSVEIWDLNGSGVDGSTVEYALSTEGPFSYSFWVPVWVDPVAEFVNPSLNYKFGEGDGNYVKWRAKDMAANGYMESAPVNIKIDTTYVDFATELTEQVDWYDSSEITTGIYVRDLGSGVNLSSFEVRISTAGSTGFGEWMPVDVEDITEADIEDSRVGSTGLSTDDWSDEGAYKITTTFTYAEGADNYIMFRGTDMVGNPLGSSEKFNLKVDTSRVYFRQFTPGEDEYSNKREVECFIELKDDGSGVDPKTVEYSVANEAGDTGVGGDEKKFGPWKKAVNVVVGNPTQVSMDIEFEWGRDNFIRWRADDLIGSGYNISPSYRIWVNSNPEPVISLPKDGFNTYDDMEILFDASNSSDMDGDAINFTWYTNRSKNVPLSTESLFREKLAAGHHLITLHVDDGHGNNLTSTIKVNVKERDDGSGDLFGFSSDGTVLWLIIGLCILILIAAILILFFVVRKKGAKDGKEKELMSPPGPPGLEPATAVEQERFHPPMEDQEGPRSFPPPQDIYVPAPGTSVETQGEIPGPLPELSAGDSTEGDQLALPAWSENVQPVEPAPIKAVGTPPQAVASTSAEPTEAAEHVAIAEKDGVVPGAEAPAKTSSSIGDALEAWSLDFEKKTPAPKPIVEASSMNEPWPDIGNFPTVSSEGPEASSPTEAVAETTEDEVREVVLTCYSCSSDYAASISELPIIVVCPHCGTEGQIDSL